MHHLALNENMLKPFALIESPSLSDQEKLILLSAYPVSDLFEVHPQEFYTLLGSAIRSFCSIGLISWLLKQGLNPEQSYEDKNQARFTAIHDAAMFGRIDVLDLLLSKGISLQTLSTNGWSVLHSAACGGQVKTIKWLLQLPTSAGNFSLLDETKDGNNVVHIAASYNKNIVIADLPEIVKNIRDSKVSVRSLLETPNKNGHYLLHIAAACGNSGLIGLLLHTYQWKHDLRQNNKFGNHFVHIASRRDQLDLLMALTNNCSASISACVKQLLVTPNKLGWYPIHSAAMGGHARIVAWLLNQGVNPNIRSDNSCGESFFHSAIEANHSELVKMLLLHPTWSNKVKPLLWQKNLDEVTPLALLIEKNIELYGWLIDQSIVNKSDLNVSDLLSYLKIKLVKVTTEYGKQICTEVLELLPSAIKKPLLRNQAPAHQSFEHILLIMQEFNINLDEFPLGEMIAKEFSLAESFDYFEMLLSRSPKNFIKMFKIYYDQQNVIDQYFANASFIGENSFNCSRWGLLIARTLKKEGNNLKKFFDANKLFFMLGSMAETHQKIVPLHKSFSPGSQVSRAVKERGIFLPGHFKNHSLCYADEIHYLLLISTLIAYSEEHGLFNVEIVRSLQQCLLDLAEKISTFPVEARVGNFNVKVKDLVFDALRLSIDRLMQSKTELTPNLLLTLLKVERQQSTSDIPMLKSLALDKIIRSNAAAVSYDDVTKGIMLRILEDQTRVDGLSNDNTTSNAINSLFYKRQAHLLSKFSVVTSNKRNREEGSEESFKKQKAEMLFDKDFDLGC